MQMIVLAEPSKERGGDDLRVRMLNESLSSSLALVSKRSVCRIGIQRPVRKESEAR